MRLSIRFLFLDPLTTSPVFWTIEVRFSLRLLDEDDAAEAAGIAFVFLDLET